MNDLGMNTKKGSAGVRISKWRLNGRSYKEWMKSLAKAKRSDPSIQWKEENKRKFSRVTEPKGPEEDDTTDSGSPVSRTRQKKGSEEDDTIDSGSPISHTRQKNASQEDDSGCPVPLKRQKRQNVGRVDFLLKRVKNAINAEKSNIPNDSTRTKKKRNYISLQENFTQSTENAHKSSPTKFVEYWVPVRLSNVQTELYCGSLFSNLGVLCSSSKHYEVETLHKILVSTRKCCDHPYLVDSSLCETLIQQIPQPEKLDAEIKLSSKLLLLHKILQEISKRGLRVVILYQTLGGPEPVSTGHILDDIIHENFGEDSYIRIGGALPRSKKRALVNSYNNKGSGKFICLLPTRACVPSIHLQSVDIVIFFNSDWDPMNDLRALQKISLDSQLEHVKVFRLYSAHTVEEKLLMLAKLSTSPEGNLLNIRRSTCHELLTWGAHYLFKKLDDFHGLNTDGNHSVISDSVSFVEDVFQELSNLLPNNKEISVQKASSYIVKVEQIGGLYPRNICLLGEVEYPLLNNYSAVEEMMLEEPAYVLWINLLQGRKPSWKYFSSQSPRSRKCVQRFDDILEAPVRASKNCRAETRMRSVNELQSRDKKSTLPGEAAAPTKGQAPMLGNPSPTEPCLPDEQDLQTAPTTSNSRTNLSPSERPLTQSQVLQSVNEFKRELERLQKERTELLKQHEEKKLQLNMASNKEIDEIQKKYEMMLRAADVAFVEEREILDTAYNKVLANKSLAEAMLQRTNTEHADLPQGQHMSGSSTNLKSSHQLSQTSVSLRLSASPPDPMYNHRITFSGNIPPRHQMTAPPPHLTYMVPPLPPRPLLPLSFCPDISFSSVSLKSKAQSRI